MIQNQDTSLEAGHKLGAKEIEKSETVAARQSLGTNQREQFTDIAPNKSH